MTHTYTFLLLWLFFASPCWADTAHTLIEQAESALANKRYDQANHFAIEAFQMSLDANEQGKALTLLGLSLLQQENWYASAQALQGALAQDGTQYQAKEALTLVLKKLPRSLVRTLDSDKVGDRFEGSVLDWDENELAWETKDILTSHPPKSAQRPTATDLSSTSTLPHSPAQQKLFLQADQQRQDWVLSGEMRDKQASKKQFYQRLFSLEAGFAVVQDQAQEISGVNPW